MRDLYLYRLAFLLFGAALTLFGVVFLRRGEEGKSPARWVLSAILGLNIGFVVYLWFNHIGFPLNLDLMEGTILEHFRRAAALRPVYPEPTPAYVPLAYNPLFYYLAVPFSWIFGVDLFTMRFTAILGMIGSGAVLFTVVRRKTESAWWGFAAVGLFAAAYRVMDAYLDSAHSDSWLLFSALLGTYLIDRDRSKAWNIVGVLVLCAAFWFKQHGALFAVGGVLFLTWRKGIKRSLVYWLTAIAAGPLLYAFAGPALFGSHFHYFTYEVPRKWSFFGLRTLRRYIGFIALSYPVLALSGGAALLGKVLKDAKRIGVWEVQFVFALLTGFMGSLDADSSNNIFIPMGTWFIMMGLVALREFSRRKEILQRFDIPLLASFISLSFFIYNPLTVVVSPRAGDSYGELVSVLEGMPGPVYAPWLGQLQKGYSFYPAAHWVALEDMIRGPGRATENHPGTRALLEPSIDPGGPAYILANRPLGTYPFFAFLEDYYVLESDYGDRFKALRVLPKRWDHGWPRYLYRHRGAGVGPE